MEADKIQKKNTNEKKKKKEKIYILFNKLSFKTSNQNQTI